MTIPGAVAAGSLVRDRISGCEENPPGSSRTPRVFFANSVDSVNYTRKLVNDRASLSGCRDGGTLVRSLIALDRLANSNHDRVTVLISIGPMVPFARRPSSRHSFRVTRLSRLLQFCHVRPCRRTSAGSSFGADKRLQAEDPEKLCAAAKSLGMREAKDAIPALTELLKNRTSRVKWTAAETLWRLEHKGARPPTVYAELLTASAMEVHSFSVASGPVGQQPHRAVLPCCHPA